MVLDIFFPPIALSITSSTSPTVSPYRAACSLFIIKSMKYPPVTLSANTLLVPGTSAKIFSTCTATSSIFSKSGPKTLIPRLLLKPVDNISVLVWIGIQNIFAIPGNFIVSFISDLSFSQVIPALHWSSGFKVITVSTILRGAGSVAVFARPIFPNTLSTSGNFISILSWMCRILEASVIDIPGTAVGIYSIDPSLSGGMNSEPSL